MEIVIDWWNSDLDGVYFGLRAFRIRRLAGIGQLFSGCIILIDILGENWFRTRGEKLNILATTLKENSLIITLGVGVLLGALTLLREVIEFFLRNDIDALEFIPVIHLILLAFVWMAFIVLALTYFLVKYVIPYLLRISVELPAYFLTHEKFKYYTTIASFVIFLLSSFLSIIFA